MNGLLPQKEGLISSERKELLHNYYLAFDFLEPLGERFSSLWEKFSQERIMVLPRRNNVFWRKKNGLLFISQTESSENWLAVSWIFSVELERGSGTSAPFGLRV